MYPQNQQLVSQTARAIAVLSSNSREPWFRTGGAIVQGLRSVPDPPQTTGTQWCGVSTMLVVTCKVMSGSTSPSQLTAGGPQNDVFFWKKVDSGLKDGHFLVSMTDFWGVAILPFHQKVFIGPYQVNCEKAIRYSGCFWIPSARQAVGVWRGVAGWRVLLVVSLRSTTHPQDASDK